MKLPNVNILGIRVNGLDMDETIRTIEGWIDRRERHYVCVTGVHGVMESWRDEKLRGIHNNAGLVTADGMPLVWLSRLLGFPGAQRVYGPDLMLAACATSVRRGYRHFFYGGAAGIAQTLVARLESRFPGLRVAGHYSPPFRPLSRREDQTIIEHINSADPEIIWVGLGTPKQECWMSEHRGALKAPVLIGVGAAFDFHAGLKRQAPRWMQRSGLEWLFRLGSEPTRLWRRYLVNNPWFLWLMALQLMREMPSRLLNRELNQ
jgi:N-acetylglucosaminyldiphosphoundecaprenol N-acetyl-beta-D-mannosaminyltransferase